MKTILILITAFVSVFSFASQAPSSKTSAPRVFFLNLKNGQTITSPFKIKFGLEGMTLRPAGEITPGTGHHHLIIDGDAVPSGQVVPADATHIHFGKAQTEAEIVLKPGPHKLLLQFANGAHQSYGPEVSAVVDVTVK